MGQKNMNPLKLNNYKVFNETFVSDDYYYLTINNISLATGTMLEKPVVSADMVRNGIPASFYDSQEAKELSYFVEDIVEGKHKKYDTNLIACNTMLTHKGKVFLGLRGENTCNFPNTWTVPSGRCSEKPSKTLRKELVEEVTIIVQNEEGLERVLFLGHSQEHHDIAEKAYMATPFYKDDFKFLAADLKPVQSLKRFDFFLYTNEDVVDKIYNCNVVYDNLRSTLEIGVGLDLVLPDGWEVKDIYFHEHPDGECGFFTVDEALELPLTLQARENLIQMKACQPLRFK